MDMLLRDADHLPNFHASSGPALPEKPCPRTYGRTPSFRLKHLRGQVDISVTRRYRLVAVGEMRRQLPMLENVFDQRGGGAGVATAEPGRLPAETSATTSVVASQLSVPSASGASVGMRKARPLTRDR
jgi:hypothetical protein